MELVREHVRKRPGMYAGDLHNGGGVLHLLFEVVGNAFDQYLAGRCRRIELRVDADDTITVSDDGPGIAVSAEELTQWLEYRFERPTADGHRPHAHFGIGGLGLGVANALSGSFELTTVRAGEELRARYAHGFALAPIAIARTQRPSGTTVRLRADDTLFKSVRVPRIELAQQLEDLSFLAPGLALSWTIAADGDAARGLAGRVAVDVREALGGVAHHRGEYTTDKGPAIVEVALAWRIKPSPRVPADNEALIHGFVNLKRTLDGGMHVAGLTDGVRKFFGRAAAARGAGMVAAVSVILADVIYGSPIKSRLASPEVRPVVKEATVTALRAWAEAWPEAAAIVRARGEAASGARR